MPGEKLTHRADIGRAGTSLRITLSGLVLAAAVLVGAQALSAPFPSKAWSVGTVLGVALAAFIAIPDRRRLLLRAVGFSSPLAAVAFWLGSQPAVFHYGGAQSVIEIGAMDLLLVPLLFVLAMEVLEGRRRLRFAEAGLGVLAAFLVWGALSVAAAGNYVLGFNELFRVSRIFLGYFIVSQLVDNVDDLQLILRWLLVGATVQAMIAFYQYRFGTPGFLQIHGIGEAVSLEDRLSGNADRVGGLIGYATSFAQYLSIMIPIAVGFALTAQRTRGRVVAIGAGLLCTVALVLTFTRGVLLILPICLVAVVFLVMRRIKPRRSLLAVALTVVLLGAAFAATSTLVLRRFDETTTSITGRLDMYRVALRIIRANPLLGVGLNNYSEAKVRYDPTGIDMFPWPVHDVFLFFAAEVGLPGLAMIAVFLALTYTRAVHLYHVLPARDGAMVAAMIVGYSAPLAYGVIDTGFKTAPALWWVLWILSGAVTALSATPHQRRTDARSSRRASVGSVLAHVRHS